MNKMKPLAAAIAAASAISASTLTLADGGPAVDDRIAELERQLAELKAMVSSNQQAVSTTQEVVAANTTAIVTNQADIEEARPMAKGTKFTYGGYVQLDAIHSDYSDGKPTFNPLEDLVVASTIPVEPVSGESDDYQSTNIHAKTSRFFFTTKTPTDAGTLSSRIELDFILSGSDSALDERISNSWNSRLRHAFVKWDYNDSSSILAGQTWSTFFNVSALPDLIDFVGPVGTIFIRQPQVRWTMGGLQLAVENPATRLNGIDESGGLIKPKDDSEKMPDLVARYNGKWGNLNWSIAGLARELAYDTRAGQVEVDSDEEYGYGLSLSGKWTFGKDDIRFMANYGDALGRYMGLMAFEDGYIDESGSIETIDQWGAFIAYRHFWSDRWRSTFSASYAEADNPGLNDFALANGLAESYQTYHANLNWLPAPKLSIGGELIYAEKEVEDGRSGDLSRIQFAVKYAF